MEEAPVITPFIKKSAELEQGLQNTILKETPYEIVLENAEYTLNCCEMENNKILLKLCYKDETIMEYYENLYDLNKLTEISDIFKLRNKIEYAYKILNKALGSSDKNIKSEGNLIILNLKFLFPDGEEEEGRFELHKQEKNINEIIKIINTNIKESKENQSNMLKLIDDSSQIINDLKNKNDINNSKISEITEKINKMQEINKKIEEDRNNVNERITNYEKQNENNINEIKSIKEEQIKVENIIKE